MVEPKSAGKRDWVGILTLVAMVVVPLASGLWSTALYLNRELHQIDKRLIRIETSLGVGPSEISLTLKD